MVRCYFPAVGTLLAVAATAFAQSQIQHPYTRPTNNQHQIDLGTTNKQHQIDISKGLPKYPYQIKRSFTQGLGSDDKTPWAQRQADDLLDVVKCYLDQPSLANELSVEAKDGGDPSHLIEVRIQLLKTLAKGNAASHCR